MNQQDITVRTVTGSRGSGLRAWAADAAQEDIGPVVASLFGRVTRAMAAIGATPTGPGTVVYDPAPEVSDDALRISLLFPLATDEAAGLEPVDVPAGSVASLVHRGAVDGIDETYRLLRAWAVDHGWTSTGSAREVYLHFDPADPGTTVIEVQLDVER